MIFLHRQNNPSKLSSHNVDGLELDIRSIGDDLIISHDRINAESSSLTYLNSSLKYLKNFTLIINVKESGLEEQISELLDLYNIKYYFLDSQIPDIIRLCRKREFIGKFIIRISDFEDINYDFLDYTKPEFLWIDYSKLAVTDDFNLEEYFKFLENIANNKSINTYKKILVSPELYSLSNINITNDIVQAKGELLKNFSVCTKLPEDWRKIV